MTHVDFTSTGFMQFAMMATYGTSVSILVNDRVEWIPTHKIVTDEYQRDLVPIGVARIVNEFDPAMLGVLVVNQRADGSYAILDGQHRLAALRIMGIQAARCIVLSGLTLTQEADYFRYQSKNTRRLTSYDLFNAGICAKDPHYVALKYTLDKHGFRVQKTGGPRCICAVSSLSKIAQLFGFDVLDQQLAYIAATWHTDTVIVRREMLAGLSEFVNRFGMIVPVERFASRMRMKHPSELLYEFQRRNHGQAHTRGAFKPSVRFSCCSVLVDAYNEGLGSGSKHKLQLKWIGIDRGDA